MVFLFLQVGLSESKPRGEGMEIKTPQSLQHILLAVFPCDRSELLKQDLHI